MTSSVPKAFSKISTQSVGSKIWHRARALLPSFSWWCSYDVYSWCICNSRAEQMVKAVHAASSNPVYRLSRPWGQWLPLNFDCGMLAVLTAERVLYLVLSDALNQCQVLRVNKTSSETCLGSCFTQIPVDDSYNASTTGNNAAGQHIWGMWTGHMSSRWFSWNNCSGLPKKEEWLLVLGGAHHPFLLLSSPPGCLSTVTRSRAKLVPSLGLLSSSSVGKEASFNYRQFCVFWKHLQKSSVSGSI